MREPEGNTSEKGREKSLEDSDPWRDGGNCYAESAMYVQIRLALETDSHLVGKLLEHGYDVRYVL